MPMTTLELNQKIETIDHCTVELIKTNASDIDVAYAAWVSNFAEDAKTRDVSNIDKLINFLYRENHTSPFEHGSFTVFVESPIFVAREFMRHRTWSYNETSGRYKILEGRFYLPPVERPLIQKGKVGAYQHFDGTEEHYALMKQTQLNSFQTSWDAYLTQLNAGVAKEVARNVLPLATMTQYYGTVNPLNMLKFFILRSEDNALWEIREQVSKPMEEIFKATMPRTYEAFDRTRTLWARVRKLLEEHTIDELEAAFNGPD